MKVRFTYILWNTAVQLTEFSLKCLKRWLNNRAVSFISTPFGSIFVGYVAWAIEAWRSSSDRSLYCCHLILMTFSAHALELLGQFNFNVTGHSVCGLRTQIYIWYERPCSSEKGEIIKFKSWQIKGLQRYLGKLFECYSAKN